MANFDVQIQALAGTATQSEMDQWMMDGTREIINILPPDLKETCYSKQTFTSAAANSEAETMITGQLGSVFAGSVECRKIRPMDKHKASSATSLEYATSTDPVYYVEGGKINILPASSSGIYYVIANPSIDASGVSAIDNFPNEAEYLVVLYAAIKVLQNKMNEKTGDLPNLALPVLPTDPTMSAKTVSITGTAPIYTKPEFVLDAKPGISDLSISSPSAPTAPTLNTVFYVNAENADASATSVSAASSSVISKADISGNAPTYVKNVVAPDFADADNWLNTEEDSELVTSRIQIISTQLQEYQANIQNELNEYNKENSIYQANVQAELAKHNSDLQTAINNANLDGQDKRQEATQTTDIDKFNKAQDQALELENKAKEMEALIQENNIKISKYSQEISSYQAQISKEVQVYQQNLQKDIQLWQGNNSSGLQKYSQDIQNELNEFNDANVEYQALLQKDLQDAQLAESKEGRDLQKYANQLSSYQAEVTAKVQDFQKALEKHSINYQWYQSQYAQLKQDYNQGLSMLVGASLPQPSKKQQGER